MLRITIDTGVPTTAIKADVLRKNKGNLKYGLKISRFNTFIKIYNAYNTNRPLTYLYARLLDANLRIIATYELSTAKLTYSNGQYVVNNAYYDTVSSGLIDGLYFLEFSDGIKTFKSELFRIAEAEITGIENKVSIIKQFQDDPIFEFNDI